MSNKKQIPKAADSSKSIKNVSIIAGILVVITVAFFIVKGSLGGGSESAGNIETAGGDLIIPKSEITDTVKFYPLKVGKTRMEIMAVKASDGTIRTAFNTCQVCNGSPAAYYKQEGNQVVCQNCKNRFKLDMIEQQRGGCNPVPIMKEDKTDDGTNIIIPKDYIEKNKDIFTDNWKT